MNPLVLWSGVAIGAVSATIAISRWLAPQWRAARHRIRLVCTCGHVPNRPTTAADRVLRMVARGVVWIQVGRVEVSGAENLRCDAPKLIAPTHGHYVDAFVLALVLPDRARAMAARGLLQFGGGLGALLFSRWGLFCTDLTAGKGAPALKAAVGILASGQTLLMFPEGWAHMDGVVGSFKRGAASIARMAEAKVGRPVSIVPVYLRYGAYPGSWIRKLPPPLQYLIVLMGLMFFRRGVHVVVGEPLLSSHLPKDATLATEDLRRAVLALARGPRVTDSLC